MIDRLVIWARRLRPDQLRQARTVGLTVGGLASLTAAAWDITRPLGLAAAGAALLTLEFLTSDGDHGRP